MTGSSIAQPHAVPAQVQVDADQIRLCWPDAGHEVILALDQGEVVGARGVILAGVPVRNGRKLWRPMILSPSGVHYHSLRYRDHAVAADGTVEIRMTAVGVPGPAQEEQDEYLGDIVDLALPDAPCLDTLVWAFRPSIMEVDGSRFTGLAYRYHFVSATQAIYRLFDRATWEIGGHLEGNTLRLQGQCNPPVMALCQTTDFTTACNYYGAEMQGSVGIPDRVSFQRLPRIGTIQAFDLLVHEQGALVGIFEPVEEILSIVQTRNGEDYLHVVDEHRRPLSRDFQTHWKHMLFHQAGENWNTATQANLWTRVYDHVHETARQQAGIARSFVQPRIWIPQIVADTTILMEKEIERVRLLYELADRAIPQWQAMGVKEICCFSIWESDYTRDRHLSKQASHNPLHGALIVGSICNVRDHVIDPTWGGPEALAYFVDKAHKAGMQVQLWFATHMSVRAEIFAQRPDFMLTARDFSNFDHAYQPIIVDWFAPGSRDLILHGVVDHHCKFGLRRSVLYRNVAQEPGAIAYAYVGQLNFKGDPAMVPVAVEERPYEVYGSAMSVAVDHDSGQKYAVISVGGKVHYFSDLADDGLSFNQMQRLDIPFESNRAQGWQEIDVDVDFPVRYIRLGNDRNGMGNIRDSFLHVLQFEAIDEHGTNVTNIQTHPSVKVDKIHGEQVPWYQIQRPTNMLTPGNANTATEFNATSFGFFIEDAQIELQAPTTLSRIRFELSDEMEIGHKFTAPFRWQGKVYSMTHGPEDTWYHYELKVSPDGENWTTVADRRANEMFQSHPVLIDFNGNGKLDLLLGYVGSNGIYPGRGVRYRVYLNDGTDEQPRYGEPIYVMNSENVPLVEPSNWGAQLANQSGIVAIDLNGNGQRDLLLESVGQGLIWVLPNVSQDSDKIVVERSGWPQSITLGDSGVSFRYTQPNRAFAVADVNGNGLLDLINITSDHSPMILLGVDPRAPRQIFDLEAVAPDGQNVIVSFNRYGNTPGYEIRWSDGEEINALNWRAMEGVKGTFTVAANERQQVTLSGLPEGREIWIAARAQSGDLDAPLSNVVKVATPPLRQERLMASAAVSLNAAEPQKASDAAARTLEVRARTGSWGGQPQNDQKVIVLRFADLPKQPVERAELTMRVDMRGQHDVNPTLGPMTRFVSVNALDTHWDPATATWQQSREGTPWPEQMLDRGGAFISFASFVHRVQNAHTLRWDVTDAVRQAQQQGRDAVDLLVRVDYSGHYVSRAGFNVCGPGWENPSQRPGLVLTTR